MTPTAQPAAQTAPRSVSIDTLPLAHLGAGERPRPRAALSGLWAVWADLRNLRPAVLAALGVAALAPLVGALLLGSRSPEAASEGSLPARLEAPSGAPRAATPSDRDHGLVLRPERLRRQAPPEGFYGAGSGKGRPIEEPVAAEEPAHGGMMVAPEAPAAPANPQGRLQPVAFTGAAGAGGAGGAPAAPVAAPTARPTAAAPAPKAPAKAKLRALRGVIEMENKGVPEPRAVGRTTGFRTDAPTKEPGLQESTAGAIVADPSRSHALYDGQGPNQQAGARNFDGWWRANTEGTQIRYQQGMIPRNEVVNIYRVER
ncbi:MAG: hypothetical protein HY553_21395 [Elusimicrobia bacterium]|nr:hypothetical protein [Elusimicrobiota bacterium]